MLWYADRAGFLCTPVALSPAFTLDGSPLTFATVGGVPSVPAFLSCPAGWNLLE